MTPHRDVLDEIDILRVQVIALHDLIARQGERIATLEHLLGVEPAAMYIVGPLDDLPENPQ